MEQYQSNRTNKPIAFFKTHSVTPLPVRPGPKNTLRPCNRCFKKTDTEPINNTSLDIPDAFDNLKFRRSDLPSDNYRSVQFHPGQLETIRQIQETSKRQIIFVIGLGYPEDYQYVIASAKQCNVNLPPIAETTEEAKEMIKSGDSMTLLLHLTLLTTASTAKHDLKSSVGDNSNNRTFKLIDNPTLWEILNCINPGKLNYENLYNSTIVQIVVSKDYKLGSVCIHAMQPLELEAFQPSYSAGYPTSLLVKHLVNSMISNAIVLPTHIIAHLVLNLEREYGPTFEELVGYTSWLMKRQLELDLFFGFSGNARHVVEFALLALEDCVGKSRFTNCYQPTDIQVVSKLSQLVASHLVYHGFIAKSLLIEYNKSIKNKCLQKLQQLVYFEPGMELKLVKDNLVKTCEKICEPMDKFMRPTCKSLEDHIESLLSDMESFGKYLKVHEPKVKPRKYCAWAGELEESDEEYFEINKNNPDFKCSISLTNRDYRLDRLNLFLNSTTNLCEQLLHDI